MSQEQKAKAYDEAIRKIKGMMPNWERLSYNGKTFLQDLINIFPELTESKDEEIRKEILEYFQQYENEELRGVNISDWIAWLEKQGSNLVKNGYTNNKDVIEYAGNYSREIWHKLMDNFKNIKDYHIGCNDVSDIVLNAIINTYNWLEKQDKQKHIEKDLEMVNPSDKAEQKPAWSEEDENVVEDIKEAVINTWGGDTQDIILDWLKFLKQRYTWKPSKEQMDAMQLAVSCFNCKWTSEVFALLKSLYEDLKKLKG